MRSFVERGMCSAVAVLAIALVGLTPRQAFSEWSVGEPIVTYWGDHDQSYVTGDRSVRGGYNLNWASNMAEVGLADKFGLRTRLRADYNGSVSLGGLLEPDTLDDPVRKAALDDLIAEYKTHPTAGSHS